MEAVKEEEEKKVYEAVVRREENIADILHLPGITHETGLDAKNVYGALGRLTKKGKLIQLERGSCSEVDYWCTSNYVSKHPHMAGLPEQIKKSLGILDDGS